MGSGGGPAGPFGRLLRELRQDRRLTIEELAEASGVSGRAIGDMERGRSRRPHRGTVTALAQGLELDEPAHARLLAAARAARPGPQQAESVRVSPHTLPRGVRDFVGRQGELAELRALAREAAEGGEGRDAPAPPAAVVYGPPGSGKTTLAVRLAEGLTSSCPDGAFLVDMRGLDERPLPADQVLSGLLGSWGVPDAELAGLGAEELLARYRDLSARLRAVLVLDNAGSEDQIRPLLPREGRLLVVVTSRRTLAGLEGVRRVELGALNRQESAALLRAVVGTGRVDAEPAAANVVTELCGHLPLALRVAANWAATRTSWSLRRLADRLADEDRRLDALSAGDLRVNSAFALSYSRLAPEAARMFRLLSLVPGGDFGVPPAAVLAGVSLPEAEDLLEELLEAGLLLTARQDRYRLHDLLRLYAASRHRAEDGTEGSLAARSRLRHWLLDTAVLAGRWYEPDYGMPPADPGRLVALDDREQAARWIRTEGDSWLAAFREAAAAGEHTRVAEVAEAMHWFSDHWVSWGHWVEVYERAAAAGAALGDAGLEATHRNYLAWAYWACARRHHEAVDAALCALCLAEGAGDTLQQAWAHAYLGWLRDAVDDLPPAADHYRRAMELFTEADDVNGYLQVCCGVVRLMRATGRPQEAVETYRGIMETLADPRHRDRIPPNVRDFTTLSAVYSVSFVHLDRGDWREAADALRGIRGQFDARGWHKQASKVHLHLAHALARLGERAEAAAEYRAVLWLEGLVPAEVREDARTGLAALAGGRPAPPPRFTL
ncbi:tetratricopeptide TPR-2 repeat-containing protein [Streptomyces viridochromogenes DSM 40736]|uniref:Tetratricopeptide TPR-2 repeat-containing protein n=1 Tax=Streptomyces viridochromogenes (strain DSM 40736 / JCM 4977 / BCRC 1201 / Tue 494) TaxID=591159 RepID=D9XDM9_STRVT|nr:helix-turn-helix domain-containing protein [Streptomyces viridochromogenes]EFL30408.1 tetratricopeptide TPR-2 repeat-containing protein [Streptomyces viridochromogenes DSM 40736]